MDRLKMTIERIGVDGRGRDVIRHTRNTCIDAMTLDFSSFSIFWLDRCASRLQSVRVDGILAASSISISFPAVTASGMSVYEDYVYWPDSSTKSLRRVNHTAGEPVVQVSQTFLPTVFGGVEVVHPSKQPYGKPLPIRTYTGKVMV